MYLPSKVISKFDLGYPSDLKAMHTYTYFVCFLRRVYYPFLVGTYVFSLLVNVIKKKG